MKAWRDCGGKGPGILNLNIKYSIIKWTVDKPIKMGLTQILRFYHINFFICNKLYHNTNFSKQKLVTLHLVLQTHNTQQCKLGILLGQHKTKLKSYASQCRSSSVANLVEIHFVGSKVKIWIKVRHTLRCTLLIRALGTEELQQIQFHGNWATLALIMYCVG